METLPSELYTILSNTIINDTVISYLPLPSRLALGRTSKSFKGLIIDSPDTFRSLDLSRCRGAYTRYLGPVDTGGQSFRAERMDEALTEDDFYAGPLRGVLGRLGRRNILPSVKTLILDRLASITNDLLHEVLTSSNYDIRLLSIRRCPNVNQYKLQQLLQYLCRPGRTEYTPRLRGLYYFTDPYDTTAQKAASGVTGLDGAQLGALPTDKGEHSGGGSYYESSGAMLPKMSQADLTLWAHIIATCKGIIWFDAVLCTHMHIDMEGVIAEHIREQRPALPTMATVALGQAGCASCGRAPNEAPVWRHSAYEEFPLLWPPPASGSIVDAICPPPGNAKQQRLIVSCQWCIDNRHCDSCHRWWCGDCYNPKRDKLLSSTPTTTPNNNDNPHTVPSALEDNASNAIKVHNGFCVEHCLRGELMSGAGAGGMWG